MSQEVNRLAPAIYGELNRRRRLWWLAGAVAVMAGLRVYSGQAVRRAKAEAPPAEEFITVEGVRLHYLSRGTGRTVVLLHGSGLVLWDFVYSILDQVAASYHVIAFDRPGFGYSERPANQPLTLALHARLIHAALNRLGVEKPVLVGHSGGGSVALHYAIAYPDEVAGLVLLGTAACAEGLVTPPFHYFTHPPVIGRLMVHALLPPLVQAMAPPFVTGLFAPYTPPDGYVEMLTMFLIRPGHFRAYADELKHLRAGLAEQSLRYGEISAPVTILNGKVDQVATLESQALPLQRALPNARLMAVEGTGHAIHHQHPALVMDGIRQSW